MLCYTYFCAPFNAYRHCKWNRFHNRLPNLFPLLFSLINKENSGLISHSLAELVLAISKFPISKFTDRKCLSFKQI